MIICANQIRPYRGDIEKNLEKHKRFCRRAIEMGAQFIVFPELSLTGYEPQQAAKLAVQPDDERLDDFQILSDTHQTTIGVGAPLKTEAGIEIGMILFRAHRPRAVYSKRYLHADEEPFFVSGENFNTLLGPERDIALAICYEISVPEHPAQAKKRGARIYCASVAKTAGGVQNAHQTLSTTASQQGLLVLMANCVGPSGDGVCAGQSAAWDEKGRLLGKLDDDREGILAIDTNTRRVQFL
jgi:predicted amidohydrolase